MNNSRLESTPINSVIIVNGSLARVFPLASGENAEEVALEIEHEVAVGTNWHPVVKSVFHNPGINNVWTVVIESRSN